MKTLPPSMGRGRRSDGLRLRAWIGVSAFAAACAAPLEDSRQAGPQVDDSNDPADTGLGDPVEPIADADQDGLTDEREGELGTDPSNPDTDGDLAEDGAELSAGTNPLYALSHPYAGGYNVGYCADGVPPATGPTGSAGYGDQSWEVYAPGDVASDFAFLDQHHELVHLYSFCDRLVMLAFVGSGSNASLDLAEQFQSLQDDFGPSNFQLIGLLVDQGVYGGDSADGSSGGLEKDSSDPQLDAMVQSMVHDYGIETVPILQLPPGGQAVGGTWEDYEHDYALPTTAYLDPQMRILSADDYRYDPADYL
jgi:hypothetical protein